MITENKDGSLAWVQAPLLDATAPQPAGSRDQRVQFHTSSTPTEIYAACAASGLKVMDIDRGPRRYVVLWEPEKTYFGRIRLNRHNYVTVGSYRVTVMRPR